MARWRDSDFQMIRDQIVKNLIFGAQTAGVRAVPILDRNTKYDAETTHFLITLAQTMYLSGAAQVTEFLCRHDGEVTPQAIAAAFPIVAEEMGFGFGNPNSQNTTSDEDESH